MIAFCDILKQETMKFQKVHVFFSLVQSENSEFGTFNLSLDINLTIVVAGIRLKGVEGLDLGVAVLVARRITYHFICRVSSLVCGEEG